MVAVATDHQALRALIPSDMGAWGINRCDGTVEELVLYRSGSQEYGWDVKGDPSVGDLLVGTVGNGSGRVIVDVCRVEGVTRRGIEWQGATDVPVLPSVGWNEVAARAGRTPTAWRRLDGDKARLFVLAILAELTDRRDVPEREGAQRQSRCRVRSARNRLRKLDAAGGVCEGCAINFRVGFGARGDRALDVHHRIPLGRSVNETETRLTDLAVLCGSCHRLVHADPQLNVEAVRAGWARIRSET